VLLHGKSSESLLVEGILSSGLLIVDASEILAPELVTVAISSCSLSGSTPQRGPE